ncbi:MAG: hypothetical protein DAHOPDDO_00956 [Ignavibacteriaceae bacterium]|nr:hypothetical protein [Ignavibacteriaceae bacterium]
MFSNIKTFVISLFLLNGCAKIDITSQINDFQNRLVSSSAFKAINLGIELTESKRRYFMEGDNHYFEILDSLDINKEKDSLYYYEYLSKYYDNIKVTLQNTVITLKANEKELQAFVEYVKNDSIPRVKFDGAEILFEKDILEYVLETDYEISIEGNLKDNKDIETILKENQFYIIHSVNNKIISAKLVYK